VARRPKTPGARRRPKRGARTPVRYSSDETATTEIPPLDAVFDKSAARVDQAPPDTGREVAFAGRSNAGKSSALNRLSRRRGLARTSRTPGRTQLLNFFSVTEGQASEEEPPRARVVDLPGYGYARTDIATRDAWQEHVEDYLARRESLVGLVLLMDVRHPFQPFDEHMLAWAEASGMRTLVLLNKADKLSKGAAAEALRAAEGRLAALPKVRPILFSALRGMGADAVLAVLRDWLALVDGATDDDGGTDAAPPVPE
jgi:GTP-binding protein